MTRTFKSPINCPYCNKPLTIVQIEITKVLEWEADDDDVQEGKGAFEDNGQGATEVFCYYCHTKIGYYDQNGEWGLFPDSTITEF